MTRFPLTRYALARLFTLYAIRVLPPGEEVGYMILMHAFKLMRSRMEAIEKRECKK